MGGNHTRSWKPVWCSNASDTTGPAFGHSCVAYKNSLYMFGGPFCANFFLYAFEHESWNNTNLNLVYAFSFATNP